MNIRSYTSQDWAVCRWDRFNKDKPVEPKSFCQFWRTVLLWATLGSIPLVGKIFLSHLYVHPPIDWEERRKADEQIDREIVWMKKWIGRPLKLLFWPVRTVLTTIGWVVIQVAGSIDDFISAQDWSKFKGVMSVLYTIVTICMILGALAVFGVLAYAVWTVSYIAFLGTLLGIPLTVLILFIVGPPVGRTLVSVASLLWNVAVASKHRVCPPVTIVRGGTAVED